MSVVNFNTASVYAKALMMLNLPKQSLSRLVSEVITIADYDIKKIGTNVFNNTSLLKETKNFLNVLKNQNKLHLLKTISELLKKEFLLKNNIINVCVSSSKPLSNEEEEELKTKLQDHFKKEILLDKSIDPSLLEGFTLSFDSYFIDFSNKAKISKIKSCILRHKEI